MANYTPLRYPGGKSKLGPYLADLLRFNRLTGSNLAEPYAGGGGASLFLLMRGYVRTIHLNDIDTAVVAFWRAVLRHNERFANEVERVPLSVPEWTRQREIYTKGSGGFELGFAFFYLNRTNRSGIMNAGVIGGKEQKGEWGIDARFNRPELAARIRRIGSMKRLISVSSVDALEFVGNFGKPPVEKPFLYLDPPYFHKGPDLYTNFYTPIDHAKIARKLRRLSRVPWLLTYDDCAEIRGHYAGMETRESDLSYSARDAKRGRELVVFSAGLRPPTVTSVRKGFRLVVTGSVR